MEIQKEKVIIAPGKSFRVFSPSLRDNFFWHYHPEYELVYVEAATGIRHVGQHISTYMESDLVLIGPNIPHLNFDYGLKTEYKQVVVQLKDNFLGDAFSSTPELEPIRQLFSRASMGISFSGEIKARVGEQLKGMKSLDAFSQLVTLVEIFYSLGTSKAAQQLNDRDTSVKLFLNDKIRMGTIYDYIHANYNATPDVNEVAASVHLSTAAFCRYFKKQTKMTFTNFVNQYRVAQSKTLLLQDTRVSQACYEVGFESISYFTKVFKKFAGETPSSFKNKYSGSQLPINSSKKN